MNEFEWQGIVQSVLSENPTWGAITVNAVQSGINEALKRELERSSTLSIGLYEALATKVGAKRRKTNLVIKAIKASNFDGTDWAEKAIAKEGQNGV